MAGAGRYSSGIGGNWCEHRDDQGQGKAADICRKGITVAIGERPVVAGPNIQIVQALQVHIENFPDQPAKLDLENWIGKIGFEIVEDFGHGTNWW